jgi:hypothetical protein
LSGRPWADGCTRRSPLGLNVGGDRAKLVEEREGGESRLHGV